MRMAYPALISRLLRRLPEVSVDALHVLLCDGDAARHGRPIRLHPDPPAEVRAHPSLGVLDDLKVSIQFDCSDRGWQLRKVSDCHLDAQFGRPALARDSVAEALQAPLRVRLVQRVVSYREDGDDPHVYPI